LKDRFRTAETIIGLHPTMLRLELSIFLTGPFMMNDTALIHCRYAGTGKWLPPLLLDHAPCRLPASRSSDYKNTASPR